MSEGGWEPVAEFAFYHSLVDDDRAHAAPALEALGRVAASWARLEHHLDALIMQVNKAEYAEELFEKQHPVSLVNKIGLVRKWFNRYPPLAEYVADMQYLTAQLNKLSKEDHDGLLTRNLLLHAIPASFDADAKTLTLHHLRFLKNGDVHSRHITVTLHQLETFFEMVQMANEYLGLVTQEMFTLEGFDKLQRRG